MITMDLQWLSWPCKPFLYNWRGDMNAIRQVMLVLVLLCCTMPAYARQYPEPTGRLSDFAYVLTQSQGAALNDELAAYEKRTGIEIAVVTVTSLDGQEIEAYAKNLAAEWGVGKRGRNDGILFLIAPTERKMQIQLASGSALSSDAADQIRDSIILPRFRSNDLAQGVIDGTHAIMRSLDGAPAVSRSSKRDFIFVILTAVGLVVLVAIVIFAWIRIFEPRIRQTG